MREIKFRGLTIEGNKMVYGDLLLYRVYPVIFDEDKEQHEVDATTVGQYTGLQDKNGKEIWEGDIVKVHFNLQNEAQHKIKKIKWWDAGAAFKIVTGKRGLKSGLRLHAAAIYKRKIEIIGNVYENPELLEGTK